MVSPELLMIRGVIASLPEAERSLAIECAEKLRLVIGEYGDVGMCALALVALEKQDG